MRLTSIVKLFENEDKSVLFNIYENQNDSLLRSFNKTISDLSVYKDLEVESFNVKYENDSYTVNMTIDIFESIAYHLEYKSIHDNCIKSIDLSYYFIDTLYDLYADSIDFKTDFDTFVKSIFTYND